MISTIKKFLFGLEVSVESDLQKIVAPLVSISADLAAFSKKARDSADAANREILALTGKAQKFKSVADSADQVSVNIQKLLGK